MRPVASPATVALVAITSLCWLLALITGTSHAADVAGAYVPVRHVADTAWMVPAWLTPLTATFLHANLLHLGFNMLMLGFCGRFVERALRARAMLLLYVVGAYAAATAQYLADPASSVPMIGASGAVSALLGAYASLFGRQKRFSGNEALNRAINIAWLAAAWVGIQSLIGLADSQPYGGIAIAAHIGGFLAGLVLVCPLLFWQYRRT